MTIRLGVRQKLLLLLFLLNLTSAAAYSFLSYTALHDAQMEGIDARLQAAAYGTLKITSRAYHDRIVDEDSVPEAEYLAMMTRLNEFAVMTGMTYVYTYMPHGDGFVTTATNATEEELAKKTFDRFFHQYDASDLMKEAVAKREIRYENLKDEYGTFRSVYIPFTTESGKIFIAGADLPIDFVNKKTQEVVVLSVAIGVASFTLFFIVAGMVLGRIIQPLIALTGHTRSLASNNFQVDPCTREALRDIRRSRGDEVGELARAMSTMLTQLEAYIEDLKETTAAKERVEGELSAARDIQMGILPRDFPAFPERAEFDLHAVMEPAKSVGGDLYDFFLMDEDHLLFLVGDVSGKGVPAALFMAVAKTLFKGSAVRPGDSVSTIMHQVNLTLARENPSELFITAFVGVLNLRTGEVEYCDAGHDAPFIMHADGKVERVTKVPGLALCVYEEFEYRVGKLRLTPGDRLVLFTDGVTEAHNPTADVFGFDRVAAAIREAGPGASPSTITGTLHQAVTTFADGAEQSDDITILVLEFRGPG